MTDRIDTSQWQRLGALFDQAISLGAAEQAELLRATQRDDGELAQALASLLAADARHHAHTSEHRERVLQGSLDAIEAPGVAVGDRVGPYVLREELGRGGMGVVFRAERVDGQVRQEVALKIVRRAVLDASGRERFLREREIVAGFQHPSIARMLDVGQAPDGSPYLAMELIRGLPITGWCDARKLDTRHRVAVFVRVCEAVQHAHANLVLHRDLKPSNVLVGEDGNPKLIDFGIAKPLGMAADDEHQQTATAHGFFSPSNVAPEQLRGERVGVACDVYQLGTLLHELLCGTTVFDAGGLTAGQFEQKILEVSPEAPSARVARANEATAQAHGAPTPAALSRELRGDLDAIVARALRKPPQERYGSVEQLADDLHRYLDGQPVAAIRGQHWYRARKFVRRHALAVGLSTTAVALVAAFVMALWMQSQRIAHERDLAQQRANEVAQVARFEADMLKQVDPTQAGKQLMDDLQAKFAAALVKAGIPEAQRPAQVASFATQLQRVNATDTARDLIDRTTLKPAVAAIDKQFRNQPVVAATLLQVLADRYVAMGLYDAAMPLQQSALATRRRVLGEDHPDTLESVSAMGALQMSVDQPGEAEKYYREALEKRRRVLGEGDPATLESMVDMGDILESQGKFSQAEPYLHEALKTSRHLFGNKSAEATIVLGNVGVLLDAQGKPGEGEPMLREAVATMRRLRGEDDPSTLDLIGALGTALVDEGKLNEAEPYLREMLGNSRRDFGDEHPNTLQAISTMGTFLRNQGKPAEAEPYLREVEQTRRRVTGGQALETLMAIEVLAVDLMEQGKLSEAEPYLREVLDKSRMLRSDKDRIRLNVTGRIGGLLVAEGKYAEAEKLLAPIEVETRKSSAFYMTYVRSMILMNLGEARTGLGEFAAAESVLIQAQRSFEHGDPKAIDTRKSTQALVDLYRAWDTAERGKGYGIKAAQWQRKLDALAAPTPAAAAR